MRSALPPLCAIVFAGCATGQSAQKAVPETVTIRRNCGILGELKRPDWAQQPNAWVYKNMIYGVGRIDGIESHHLGRTAAENRARAQILLRLSVYTRALKHEQTDGRTTTRKRAREQFSAATLRGTQVRCVWYDGVSEWAALVEMPLTTQPKFRKPRQRDFRSPRRGVLIYGL